MIPSIAELIAWLQTQNAGRTYIWCHCATCLIGTFLREAYGIEKPSNYCNYVKLFKDADEYSYVAQTEPRTMGAALERATYALAKRVAACQ